MIILEADVVSVVQADSESIYYDISNPVISLQCGSSIEMIINL